MIYKLIMFIIFCILMFIGYLIEWITGGRP